MEPRSYVTALVKGWVLILVCALIGGAAALAFAATRPAVYEAESSALVAVDSVDSGSDLWQTSNATVVLASSYAQLVTTPTVTEPAAAAVGDISPQQLARKLDAEVPLQSMNITITASDGDADRAAAMANAAVDALATAITDVAPQTSEGDPAVTLHITEKAVAPTSTSGLSTALLVAVGLAAGLAVGAVLALLRTPAQPSRPAADSVRAEGAGPDRAAPRP